MASIFYDIYLFHCIADRGPCQSYIRHLLTFAFENLYSSGAYNIVNLNTVPTPTLVYPEALGEYR